MTTDQLHAVLTWKHPTVGKAYAVEDGVLLFRVWQDRTTGMPSEEPQPTLAQCEAWLPDLPASVMEAQKEAAAICTYDMIKDLKALALVVLDEINLIRGSSAVTIAGMADRTEDQLRTAFLNKRKAL